MSTGVFKISISTNLIWGISNRFQLLSPAQRQILYILLTRPPLSSDRSQILVRLACIKHAASVRPEPGSNSPLSESFIASITRVIALTHYIFCLSTSVFSLRINKFFFSYSVFKVPIADFNLTRIFTGIYFFAEHKLSFCLGQLLQEIILICHDLRQVPPRLAAFIILLLKSFLSSVYL